MVTVSIVVHNSPDWQLRKALQCLQNSSVDKVYVMDNSETENLKRATLDFDKTKYIHIPNDGFGAGHNVAIKEAFKENSDFHLVMNADVYWKGDIISPILQYMKTKPEVGLVSPKTFYPDGSLQYTCRMLPTPIDLFFKRFLPGNLSQKRMENYLLMNFDHNKSLNCPYLLGSFMFFRTKALKECGLFDERFFMYPEDIDITRRVHEKWKTMYWPGVSIVHEHQQASRKNLKMFRIHLFNMIKYFNKWGWCHDKKRTLFNNTLISQSCNLS